MIRIDSPGEDSEYPSNSPFPQADENLFEALIRAKINAVYNNATKAIRFAEHPPRAERLFVFGGRPYTQITDSIGQRFGMESGLAQESGIKVMIEFGFNPESHREPEVRDYGDGTSGEILIFPSRFTGDLVFERYRVFRNDSDKTIGFSWYVKDNAPAFLFNPRRILRQILTRLKGNNIPTRGWE